MERRKLKLKILGQYGTITNFCETVGYGRQQISNILCGRAVGSVDFWSRMQKSLNLTDAEVWQYQNNMIGYKENEQNK